METLGFKKGENLTIVEHGGVDYISYNDLAAPLKNHKGKLLEGETIGYYEATEEFTVDVEKAVWIIDTNQLKGFSISGARPRNIRKR